MPLLLGLHSAEATAKQRSLQPRSGIVSAQLELAAQHVNAFTLPRDEFYIASVSAAQELENAYAKYEEGEYQDAIASFGRVILGSLNASQEERNEALLGRAKLFLVISQPELSLSDLGLVKYPRASFQKNAELNLVKGVAFIQAKQYSKAIDSLRLAEKVLDSNAMLLSNRAVAYQSLGKYDLARKDLEASLRLERAEATLYNLAVLEKLDKNYQRCVSILSTLINAKKTNPAVFQERGTCLARLGQVDAAITDLLKSLAINQANPYVLEELGGLIAQKGDGSGARQYLETASSLYLQSGATADYTRVLSKLEQLK